MKKIISALLICIIIALPLAFSGCSDKADLNSGYKGEIRTVEIPCGEADSVLNFTEEGKILSHINPSINRRIAAVKYIYDEAGSLKSIERLDREYAKVMERIFEYNESGLCSKIIKNNIKNGEIVFDFAYEYKYNSDGKIIEISDGNVIEKYSYNDKGLCITEKTFSKEGNLQAEAVFSYDELGNLVKVESTKGVQVYEYDTQGRLIKEVNSSYLTEYVYDENGTAEVYVKYENAEKKLTKKLEFFDEGKIVKETWFDSMSADGSESINVFLVEELSANDPDPTLTVAYNK